MSEQQAFEQALAKDRYDCPTRLVYADWLEERGLDTEAAEQRRMATPEWCEADRVLCDLSDRLDIPYQELVRVGTVFIHDGRQTSHGDDMGFHARDVLDEAPNRKAFWEAWRIVTGESLTEEQAYYNPFRCCY